MPGFLFHESGVATCPHQAPISFTPSNQRVRVNGLRVATMADIYTISGCPFQVPIPGGTKPQPCVMATLAPAGRVLINGVPAVINVGTTICRSAEQIPQGPAVISVVQGRVTAQ
jgi:hypothetical protein